LCTTSVDTVCIPCKSIPRCTYTIAGKCLDSDGSPACLCDAGYELASGACRLCEKGKFKGQADSSPCIPWTVTVCPQQGTYRVEGSPYNNSACLACPELPDNALRTAGGCSWSCEAGFDDNRV
jgi:hypothetical protein